MVGQDADGGSSRVQPRTRRKGARARRGDLEIGPLAAWSHTLDEKRRELLAGVGHELKTPLSIVLGLSARLLGDDRMAAEQREDVERIRANTYVLLKRVEDVLAVARLDSGAVALDLRQVDVAALVRDSCEGFRSVAELRGQRLDVQAPAELLALIDEDRILSVVSNLLANALRHAPPGGAVRCTLSVRPGWMTLEVADSGPGVAAGVRAQIFERYQQGSRAEGAAGGTGLGLAIVREVVGLHGGRVAIGDAPEGGAAFVVDLPLRGGGERAPARLIGVAERQRTTVERLRAQLAAGRSTPAVAVEGGAAGASALIVTADAQLGTYVQELIGPRYRVHHAGDALDAARRMAARRPDVVLLDAAVGPMAVAAMRRRLGEVPILAFAASLHDVSGLMEAGAHDCVVKPFAPEDLRARVAALVGRGRAASGRVALLGALEKAFAATPAPMALISREGRFVRVTRALCALLMVGPDELLERAVDDITHPVDLSGAVSGRRRVLAGGPVVDRGTWRLRRGDGSFIAAHVSTSLADELEGHLLWQLVPTTAEPAVTRHEAALASRTRRAFERAVHQQLLRCRRYGEQAALVRCSLDDLAHVREEHGDEAADHLAGLVFDAVRNRLRDTDVVTRLGGSEIGALLPHAGPEVQRAAVEGIREAAEGQRVYTPAGAIGTGVQIGVAALAGVDSLARAFAVADIGATARQALHLEMLDRAGPA